MADAKGLKKNFDAIFKTVNATTNELTRFVIANHKNRSGRKFNFKKV